MKNFRLALLITGIFLMTPKAGTAPTEMVVDRFSEAIESEGTPKGWKNLEFKKIPNHTQYSIVHENGNFFLKAVSKNSASGLLKEISVNPKDFPVISWRWQVENVIEKADATKKSGDDYPARIYVAFRYDPSNASLWEKTKYGAVKLIYGQYPPKAALNYVWDNKLPKGTFIDNAYTDRAKMIVVESGKEKLGQWIAEERNIVEDYRRSFGSEPLAIAFIAVMTDTDNTGESATAYFDDIVLRKP